MVFALQYWRELIMASMAIILAFVLSYYPNRVKALEGERNEFKMALEFQNETLLNDAKKYEERLKALPKEIEKITNTYKVIYKNIDEWEEDANVSKCQNAHNYLNEFSY